ncbi:hypothetical protein OROGR_014879 [Orobanche gracilis]
MAKMCTFLILSSLLIAATNATSSNIYDSRSNEKRPSNIRFYVQDALSGPKATVWEVARASITSKSSTTFGQVSVVDDLLTVSPDPNSEEMGRVQGLITSADMKVSGIAMNLNFIFTSGRYNGSTLSILGRNQIRSGTRELPVVGGTGVFRMAHGFAITSTHSFDPNTNHGVLEYDVTLFYYA